MHQKATLFGKSRHRIGIFRRENRTAAAVVRILQTNQPAAWKMHIVPTNSRLDILQPYGPVGLVLHNVGMDASKSRHAAGLVKKGV